MGPRFPVLLACLACLAGSAACGLETGGVGQDVGADGPDRFEDGIAEVEDAPVDRDDGWVDDSTPVDVDGDVEPDAVADVDVPEVPDVVDAEDVGEADVEPDVVADVVPDDSGDEGPADVPPPCDGGLVRCDDVCVDTATDPRHCGGCDLACGVPPHATTFCAAGACDIVCGDGWGDCNGVPADGCEADLTSSLENCGGCGVACTAPPNAVPRCSGSACGFDCNPGFVGLGPRCVAFGGAYLHAECGTGGVCRNPNPFTGGCSCPPGFTTSAAFRLVNDCTEPTYIWASLYFCSAPAFATNSDWGGAYQLHDSGTCAVGNPYTGRCTCPTGLVPISWRVETVSFRLSSVGLCWAPAATEISFGGAFEVGDVGSPCIVANPETGGCSCPTGSSRVNYRGIYPHGTPRGDWGTQMPICYR